MLTHPKNMTRQISLGEWYICWYPARFLTWAVVPAWQLRYLSIEMLYALYKLMYANPMGLLEHVGKVVLLLLSCVGGKHGEKVEHHAFIK
jgi:hypothetical protein